MGVRSDGIRRTALEVMAFPDVEEADILRLVPSEYLSASEIAAAEAITAASAPAAPVPTG